MQEISRTTFACLGTRNFPVSVFSQWESRDAKKLQAELGWRIGRSRDYFRDAWLSPIRLKFRMR